MQTYNVTFILKCFKIKRLCPFAYRLIEFHPSYFADVQKDESKYFSNKKIFNELSSFKGLMLES